MLATSRTHPLILSPRKANFAFMKYHVTNVGEGVPNELTYLSDEKINPGGMIFAAYRRLGNVQDAEPHVQMHAHDVPQLYCWVGDQADLSGLKIEVFIEDESFIVESPKSVYLPAGVRHAHRYVSGSGHFMGILVTGGKSYNDVTR